LKYVAVLLDRNRL